MFDHQKVEIDWGGPQAHPRNRARSPARPTAPCSPPTARPPCSPPSSPLKEPKPGSDFFPLTVNYQEKLFAAGRIPGGFFKREGRPTEKETLTSRLIDRPIRPLFAEGYRNETQVIVTVLSHDLENDPDIVGMVAASAALTLSGVPFMGPIGAARVGYINGSYVLNPTDRPGEGIEARPRRRRHRRRRADGRIGGAGAFRGRDARRRDVRPPRLPAGDRRDHPARRAGRQGAARLQAAPTSPTIETRDARASPRPTCAPPTSITVKQERYAAVDAVKAKVMAALFPPRAPSRASTRRRSAAVFKELQAKIVRWNILDTGSRIDGRDLKTVRPIVAEVGVLPRTHGSALFTRGETQALVVATLGTGEDEQMIDAWRAPTRSASCCTTTSRPTRSARPAAWARPAAARSATASSPGARIRPMLPAQPRVPLHDARRLRDHRVERLVLDGDGLRHLAGADGCRRAAEGAGRRHRHGPDQGGRALRRALRHPRRRGPSRRHGLQGRRHRERRHLAADGHQDPGHHRGDHAASRSTRRRTAACTSSARWRRRSAAPAPSSASTRRASR